MPRSALGDLFAPVLAPPAAADGCVVVGRLARTLDGRIAAANGQRQWIGGPGDILHTHRLRALCDVVLVGAGTIRHDDPRLTTREAPGPNPASRCSVPAPSGKGVFGTAFGFFVAIYCVLQRLLALFIAVTAPSRG